MNCANSTCHKPANKTCARCGAVQYCSIQCQTIDWRAGHKNQCHAKSTTLKPISAHNPPDEIWYADKPLSENGVAQKISIIAFMKIYQQKMGVRFDYTETLWADKQLKAETLNVEHDQRAIQEIMALLQSPLTDKIVICYVDPSIGFAAYARCEIPAWSTLAVYAGEIHHKPNASDANSDAYSLEIKANAIYPLKKTYSISANQRGGIARFFAHLPYSKIHGTQNEVTPQDHQRILRLMMDMPPAIAEQISKNQMVKKENFNQALISYENELDQETSIKPMNPNLITAPMRNMEPYLRGLKQYLDKIVPQFLSNATTSTMRWNFELVKIFSESQCLTANLSYSYVIVNGYVVPFFWTRRTIKIGELLGFDYGLGYWYGRCLAPDLFYKNSRKIPREIYYYKKAAIYNNKTKSDSDDKGFFFTREQYFEAIDDQKAQQLAPLQKPRSFFTLRDILVSTKVISTEHATIENTLFATQLQTILKPIEGVTIKSYFHNPDNIDSLERYNVDVVCHFSRFLHWANMTQFIKHTPINREVVQFCKCYEISQEIIFRNVNIEITIMQQFLARLQQKNVMQLLNADNDYPEPPQFFYTIGKRFCGIQTPGNQTLPEL